jgi:hypothetical protein
MGVLQEFVDLVSKLNFVTIVHEYEQGLYFRNGIALERPVKGITPRDLLEIKTEEQKIAKQLGIKRFFKKGKEVKLPEGFKIHWTGRILNIPKRYHKVLRPGLYFHLPIIEHIVTDYKQERVLNLGYISVLTSDAEPDSKAIVISCNLRYEIMDLYRAYTAVYDYEASLRSHTLSILAMKSLGRNYSDWKNPKTISSLERDVLEELRKIVTDKWGLKIHQIYITDVTDAVIYKFVSNDSGLPSHFVTLPPP